MDLLARGQADPSGFLQWCPHLKGWRGKLSREDCHRVGWRVPSLGVRPTGSPHVLAVVGTHRFPGASTPPSSGKSPSPTTHVTPLWLPLLKSKQTRNTKHTNCRLGPRFVHFSGRVCMLYQLWSEESRGPDSEFLSRNNVKSELLVARHRGVKFGCL